MKTPLIAALGALSALVVVAGPARSAGEATNDTLSCVSLMRIESTHAVDDQTILFYMRNGDIYLNSLSSRAFGLSRNRPFMYKTSTGQLCNHDIITVLEPIGIGFMQGSWSSLGKFVPTDEAHADALKNGRPVDDGLEPISPE
jgi:hypothetical protein